MKPDFLDIDKDGDKKESMKKASKDRKKKKGMAKGGAMMKKKGMAKGGAMMTLAKLRAAAKAFLKVISSYLPAIVLLLIYKYF